MNKKRIWILTLFPEMFEGFLKNGLIGTALSGNKGHAFEVKIVQIRDYSSQDYKGVDDAPFGGGPGMVMRADVLKNALFRGVISPGGYGEEYKNHLKVIMTGPRGRLWNNEYVKHFSGQFLSLGTPHDLVFICGRYEGVDERFVETYVDLEVSVGDFILSGGELAVMVFLDSAMRYVHGVLGNANSIMTESFEGNLLEHAQYTRPRDFEGKSVPEILLSGHHEKVAKWQLEQRIQMTQKHRPDLFQKYIQSQKTRGNKK